MTALLRPALLATLFAIATTVGAAAQTTAVDPQNPDAQAMPPSGAQGMPSQGGQSGWWGTMGPGMMGHGMMGGMMGQGPGMMGPGMGQGMMGQFPGMMGPGMMGMRGQMMKVIFAIADANGDGGLSFEEMTAIHKRIFDSMDANKDGKVVPEEVQSFMTP